MKLRRIWLILLILGLILLLTGIPVGGFTRILYFSTQICLSCMGLV